MSGRRAAPHPAPAPAIALAVRLDGGPGILFRQAAGGRRRADLRRPQVPLVAAGGRRQSPPRTWNVSHDDAADAGLGRFLRRDVAGRTAAALQHPARRHEPGRPAARAAVLRATSSARPTRATRPGTACPRGSPAGRRCTACVGTPPSLIAHDSTTTTSRTGLSGWTQDRCPYGRVCSARRRELSHPTGWLSTAEGAADAVAGVPEVSLGASAGVPRRGTAPVCGHGAEHRPDPWPVRARRRCTVLDPLKITLVEFSPSGGLFQFAVQMGEALADRGHEVELLTGPRPELASRRCPGSPSSRLCPPGTPARARGTTGLKRRLRRVVRAGRYHLAWGVLLRRTRAHPARRRPVLRRPVPRRRPGAAPGWRADARAGPSGAGHPGPLAAALQRAASPPARCSAEPAAERLDGPGLPQHGRPPRAR